jgi:hypothetical protein
VAHWRITRATGQQRKTLAEALAQRWEGKSLDARGGELDRERKSVEPVAGVPQFAGT